MTFGATVTVLTIAKAGNDDSENEDFGQFSFGDRRLDVALADGATESAFSRQWARALVTQWLESPRDDMTQVVGAARRQWQAVIPPSDQLPWFGQAKLAEGSASAFLGVSIRRTRDGWTWLARSVGDCDLFAFSGLGLQLRRCVPIQRHEDFSTRPTLVRTFGEVDAQTFVGRIRRPAELWIATDAFAEACLRDAAAGGSPWTVWRSVMAHSAEFEHTVRAWRDAGRMKNDDVTVARVKLP